MYLYLRGVPGGDVGERPAGLLAQRLGAGAQQRVQVGQRVAVQHGLRLRVVTRHDVAHGAQGRRHHCRFVVPIQTIHFFYNNPLFDILKYCSEIGR